MPSLQATQAIPPMAQELARGFGLQDANDDEPKRLIYIERSHSRRPVNTDEFSAWRRQHGFDDVWLEGMSLAEQITLFRKALDKRRINNVSLPCKATQQFNPNSC